LGLRSGEAFALPWKNIDFENGLVHITQSYCFKSENLGPPKNREPRTIPLNPGLAAFLKNLKIRRANGEFVLPHPPGWKHGDAAKILKSFQADIGIQKTNFHSLRASFITHLLLDGKPVTKVQHMVGHKDLSTTQRYVRLTASDLRGATDSLDMPVIESAGEVIPLAK
jgi:integrase